MSEPSRDPDQAPGSERQRSGSPSGCLSVALIFFGTLLLLPGVCASDFVRSGMSNPLASAGFALAGIGIAMIALGLILLVWMLRGALRR
jgi:hypothetical protein